jgi:hypothetical protein
MIFSRVLFYYSAGFIFIVHGGMPFASYEELDQNVAIKKRLRPAPKNKKDDPDTPLDTRPLSERSRYKKQDLDEFLGYEMDDMDPLMESHVEGANNDIIHLKKEPSDIPHAKRKLRF